MTSQQNHLKRGIVKQVLSGDSVIIRDVNGAPPPERQLNFSGITAPKLARRAGDQSEGSKDEPWAWEAREFLRKKLVGVEVLYTAERPPNAVRDYGTVYLGKDPATAENISESLVAEGLATVTGRQNQDSNPLTDVENAAKAAGKGRWSATGGGSEHVRDIKWSVENPRHFVDKQAFKPIKAIIEHVRDGSTVRAFLLPDFYHITLMLSGIRCPGFKLDANGKPDPNIKVPYAEEARFFVEIRLLQREVEIVLESVNNNNFVGTIIHPKGNIAEILLKEGFAHCVDWSMVFMKNREAVESLRAAERAAKAAKLRIWKEWQSTVPQITGKEKDFNATVVEVVNGDALILKLNNGQYKKVALASIRPPKEQGRTTDEEGKAVQRPKGFRPLYNIPWMFEAREYLRKKLIGKKVHVVIDYIQEARDGYPEKVCATVTIGGKNVAEALVSRGLATVVKYRPDDDLRSSRYDELLSAESKAAKSLVGVHSKKEAAVRRITEITDAARAKLEISSFQRAQRIEAVVEFVASGSRLRLFLPKTNVLFTFLLGGISCPRASRQASAGQPAVDGEPFGDEALQFTKERCMQREVSIQVDTHDKAGHFIGWLWTGDNLNLSVALVREGFASVHRTGEKSQYSALLKEAEDAAKQQRLRIWKDYVEEHKEEEQVHEEEEAKVNVDRKVNYEEVVVTEITPEGSFFVQTISEGPKAEALNAKLRQEFQANPPLPGAYNAKRGDLCAARYTADDEWYRVKVEKVQDGKATVHYIDYGNRETLPTTRLASLPSAYVTDKPLATEYVLPYVALPKDEEFRTIALKYLREDTATGKLLMNVEYRHQGSPPAASLHTDNTANGDIVKSLLVDGLLLVEHSKGRRQNKLLSAYKEAQEVAKRNHCNIWEYGDITEDDAKEFGLGK